MVQPPPQQQQQYQPPVMAEQATPKATSLPEMLQMANLTQYSAVATPGLCSCCFSGAIFDRLRVFTGVCGDGCGRHRRYAGHHR